MTKPYERDAEALLRHWRRVLRNVDRTETGSAEWQILMAEVQRLQDEYFVLREEAFRHGRYMPPMPPE